MEPQRSKKSLEAILWQFAILAFFKRKKKIKCIIHTLFYKLTVHLSFAGGLGIPKKVGENLYSV